MKIKGLEESIRVVLDDTYKYDQQTRDKSSLNVIKAAQTMLDLMKARESATGGEWFEDSHRPDQATIKVNGDAKLLVPNYRGSQCPTVCVLSANLIQSNDEKENNAKFITLAANLTRETGDE